jgi:hypothetical protein
MVAASEGADAQAQAVRLLVSKARSIRPRHGNLVIVFEDRAAVWRGLELALRDMAKATGHNKRIAAYVASDLLKDAIEIALHRPPLDRSEDPAFDAVLNRMYDTLQTLHQSDLVLAMQAALNARHRDASRDATDDEDSHPVLRALWDEMHEEALRALTYAERRQLGSHRLMRDLGGHSLDPVLWEFDYGILDDAHGCPDNDRRAMHRAYIDSGVLNIEGVCNPCPLRRDCRYMAEALGAPGLIINHEGAQTFDRAISVLFGSLPGRKCAYRRQRGQYLKTAEENLGADAATALSHLLDGERIERAVVAPFVLAAKRLHRRAALALGRRRVSGDQNAAIARVASLNGEQQDGAESEGDPYRLEEFARRCDAIRTVFEAGEWYAIVGRALPEGEEIYRPIVAPPLRGLFVAFRDNIDAWRPELEPLGARVVEWPEVDRLCAAPIATPKRNRIEELIDAIVALLLRDVKPTQANAAKWLTDHGRPTKVATVKDCVYRSGLSWTTIKNLAKARVAARLAATKSR